MSECKNNFKFHLKGKTLVVVDWANVYGWNKSLKWKVDIKKLFLYMKSYQEVFEQKFYHGVDPQKEWSCKIIEDANSAGFNVISKEIKWIPVYLNKQNHFKELVKKLFDLLDENKIVNSEIANKLYELRSRIESRLADVEPDFDIGDDRQPYIVGVLPSYAKEDEVIYNEVFSLINSLDQDLKKLNFSIEDLQQTLLKPVERRKCDFDVEITKDVCSYSDKFETLVLFSGDGDYAALVEDLILKDKKVIVVFAAGHKGKEYDLLLDKLKDIKKSNRLFICTVEHLEDYISL